MKIYSVKRTWSRPFFVNFKKHYCPTCGEELKKVKVSKIVHSKSEEAKEFDFSSSGGDGFMFGNVKFVWTELRCEKCDKNYSVSEIYKASGRMTKKRAMALVFLNLIPLLSIILGVWMLCHGCLLTPSFLLAFIFLPCASLIGNFFVVLSKMKIVGKTILSIFLLVLFIVIFGGINIFGSFATLDSYKNEDALEYYSKVSKNSEFMPAHTEIVESEGLEYHEYFSQTAIFFTNDVSVLICKYDEGGYGEQKALLTEKYVFQEESMVAPGYSCNPIVEIDEYVFQTLSIESKDGMQSNYPKSLFMIATNDECGWRYIR